MRKQSEAIRPFRINVASEVMSDLQRRLKNTRWTSQLKGVGWDSGTDLDFLKELVNYWQRTYDWRKHEAELNQFAHFKTNLDGIGIHFIFERGKGLAPL